MLYWDCFVLPTNNCIWCEQIAVENRNGRCWRSWTKAIFVSSQLTWLGLFFTGLVLLGQTVYHICSDAGQQLTHKLCVYKMLAHPLRLQLHLSTLWRVKQPLLYLSCDGQYVIYNMSSVPQKSRKQWHFAIGLNIVYMYLPRLFWRRLCSFHTSQHHSGILRPRLHKPGTLWLSRTAVSVVSWKEKHTHTHRFLDQI